MVLSRTYPETGISVIKAQPGPAHMYLARLAPGSRRTVCGSLELIASMAKPGNFVAANFPWELLRYEHTQAIRAILARRYAYSTANTHLTALRGVMKEAWRLGLIDSDSYQRAHEIVSHGYSASNIGFGMGGGLLQQVNRDTQKFAFKCSAALCGGTWRDVSKEPITDSGKRSKRGRLSLVSDGRAYQTVRSPRADDLLVPVYENGAVLRTYTLEEVRANAAKALQV